MRTFPDDQQPHPPFEDRRPQIMIALFGAPSRLIYFPPVPSACPEAVLAKEAVLASLPHPTRKAGGALALGIRRLLLGASASQPLEGRLPLQSGGVPTQSNRTAGLARFWGHLGQPGQLAFGGGLLLLVCFSLPWYVAPDFSHFIDRMFHTSAHVGWMVAVGTDRFSFQPPSPGSLDLFPQLWLIPLSALALLVTGWLLGRRQITPRLATGITLALAVLALLVDLSFFLQVHALEGFFGVQSEMGSLILPPAYSVAWGFWVAVAVSAATVVASIYVLLARPPQPADGEESAC